MALKRPRALAALSKRRPYICQECLQARRSSASASISASTTVEPDTSQAPNAPFALRTLTSPPTPAQLAYSHHFFSRTPRHFLLSTPRFRVLPPSTAPEVAFLGRSNVGKSSLLNALLTKTAHKAGLAHTSGKRGRTRTLNAYGVGGVTVVKGDAEGFDRWEGRGGLVVLDMPGYGGGSRREWGVEIVKYLRQRQQLRRAFVLVDAEHHIKPLDEQILGLLREYAIPHQLVVSKIDKVLCTKASKTPTDFSPQRMDDLQSFFQSALQQSRPKSYRGMVALGDILGVSAEKSWPAGSGKKMGVEDLQWAVLQASGLDCEEDGRKKTMEFDVLPEDGPETALYERKTHA